MLKIDNLTTDEGVEDLQQLLGKTFRNLYHVFEKAFPNKKTEKFSYLENKKIIDEVYATISGQYLLYKEGVGLTKKNKPFVDLYLNLYEESNKYLNSCVLLLKHLYTETEKGNLKHNKGGDSTHEGSLKSALKKFDQEYEWQLVSNDKIINRLINSFFNNVAIVVPTHTNSMNKTRSFITLDIKKSLEIDILKLRTIQAKALLQTVIHLQEEYRSKYDEHQLMYNEVFDFMNNTSIYLDEDIFNKKSVSQKRMKDIYSTYLKVAEYHKKIQEEVVKLNNKS